MLRRAAPALLLLLLLGTPALLSAQYFGRNKVQYSTFDFKIIQTEHFDVYYYDRERVAAMDAARMAERVVRPAVQGAESRVPRAQADHPVRLALRLPADQRRPASAARAPAASPTSRGTGPSCRSPARTRTSSTSCSTRWSTSSSTTSGPGVGPAAGFPTLIAINPPLWFAEGMAEYLSHGAGRRRDRDVAPGCGARRQAAHHRADDAGPLQVLPLPLRSCTVVLHRRALGRRGGRRHPQGHAGAAASSGAFRRTIGLTLRAALRPVARRGAEAVPARDRHPGQGPRRGQTSS